MSCISRCCHEFFLAFSDQKRGCMQAFAPCSCLKGACAEHTNWGSRGKKVQKRDNSDSLDECWFTAHVSVFSWRGEVE